MNNGVMDMVNYSALKWFGHSDRMDGDELTERIHYSEVDDVGVTR